MTMVPSNRSRPEPRPAQPGRGCSAGQDDPQDDEEISWLLAAALIETRRQGAPRPREVVMETLAEMTAERGAGTVARAALGLTDIAAVLLEVCADALGESPQTVLRDVLAVLRDDG